MRNDSAVLSTTVDSSLRGDQRIRAVAAAAAAATALQASQLLDETVLWEDGALLPAHHQQSAAPGPAPAAPAGAPGGTAPPPTGRAQAQPAPSPPARRSM